MGILPVIRWLLFLASLLFLSSCKEYTEEIKTIRALEKEAEGIESFLQSIERHDNESTDSTLLYKHYPEGKELLRILNDCCLIIKRSKSFIKSEYKDKNNDFYIESIEWNFHEFSSKLQQYDSIVSSNENLNEKFASENYIKYPFWKNRTISYGNLVLLEVAIQVLKTTVYTECFNNKLYRSTSLIEYTHVDRTSSEDSITLYSVFIDPELRISLYSDDKLTQPIAEYDTSKYRLSMTYEEYKSLHTNTKFYLQLKDRKNNELRLPFYIKSKD